ncbi:putative glycerophosphodiester phosphodiesterase, protein kinase RLK-Pelle-LRK10L-2 family [Senna tora]|uniref:Putative glycerophosphodiester phosphodiesterase, protein kinase RLK-Pelle-LRK10L-2 family n=1 Tax=Senna tora TaxID=362788 RepID=A0A834TFY2_9FABA|nr:putative glycerophosphodiester phosphodiesterase, protein kinase RLK-Pelle-LRK10L-2 family [Senna tora]
MNMCSSGVVVFVMMIMVCYNYKLARGDDEGCSSLCGGLNVTHPFRLKEYARECGDSRYELSCDDTQLILNLESAKFKVESINYSNYTIRVRDANVVDFNFSSLPLSSLSIYNNFSRFDPYSSLIYQNYYPEYSIHMMMVYFGCNKIEGVVNSSKYVDAAPCMEKMEGSSLWYLYNDTEGASLWDLGLEEGCSIQLIYWTSRPLNGTTYSCKDIHNMLVYGFELSWLNSFCPHNSGNYYYYAYLDHNNNTVCGSAGNTSGIRLILEDIAYILKGIIFLFWPIRTVDSIDYGAALHIALKCIPGTPFVIWLLIYKWRRRHLSMYDNIEDFLQADNSIVPIRYSYKDIKKMTQAFKVKLGKGGYGSVFRGQLQSGRLVAVKMLDKAEAQGQDFINEVATLGRIHHVNVVHLVGYCVDGSKRALIYEFMKNGSLDKYIHSQQHNDDHSLSFDQLYAISLGVARGIEYLHKGCNIQILHFDIKPHNILLDDCFNPKERKEINIENATEEETKLARKMMKVGLWCIQTNPNDRPSMNRVVEMLEGEEEDIEMPQKPYLFPQDLPTINVTDHTSSTSPPSDPSGSDPKDSVSLLAREDVRSI